MNVALRALSPADLPTLFQWENDPAANRMAGIFPRNYEAHVAHWEEVFADSSVVNRAITVGGALAGKVSAFVIGTERHIGYWVDRAFWGQGVATSGVGLFLSEFPERPLLAQVSADNRASIAILKRHGFQKTGSEMTAETERYRAGSVTSFLLADGFRAKGR